MRKFNPAFIKASCPPERKGKIRGKDLHQCIKVTKKLSSAPPQTEGKPTLIRNVLDGQVEHFVKKIVTKKREKNDRTTENNVREQLRRAML